MSIVSTFKIMRGVVCKMLYFSLGSIVYGFNKNRPHEDIELLMPISNYGAMKLLFEALIDASLKSFLDKVRIYRFPNVVGVPAAHGVILVSLKNLKKDMFALGVLNNRAQQKVYLHVSKLVRATLLLSKNKDKGVVHQAFKACWAVFHSKVFI